MINESEIHNFLQTDGGELPHYIWLQNNYLTSLGIYLLVQRNRADQRRCSEKPAPSCSRMLSRLSLGSESPQADPVIIIIADAVTEVGVSQTIWFI
jgi:hypothetical protein